MVSRTRVAAVVLSSALFAVAPAVPTAAATAGEAGGDQPSVRVEHVELRPDGSSELVMSVTGLAPGAVLGADDVRLVEDGATVIGLELVGAAGEPAASVPAAVLAVDVSGSTEGAPLAAAIDAATALSAELEAAGVRTALIAFGPDVEVLTRLEDSTGSVAKALATLVAAGETALYDGVARATRLLVEHDGPRDLVIFSDGADTVSSSGLDSVRRLAVDAEVRVTAVALDTGEMDLAPLAAITEATSGQVVRVTDPDELSAAFRGVATDLTSRYVLRWVADAAAVPPSQLSLSLQVDTPGGPVQDELVALNPRTPAITPPVAYEPPPAPVAMLATPVGLAIGIGAVFLATLLLAALVLGGSGERRRRERLAERLEGWDGLGNAPDEAVVAAASLSSRAADAVERLPTPAGLEQRLAGLLERADWPMRPSEFELLTVATTLGGVVVPLVLARSAPLAVLGLVLGAVGPTVALRMAVGRRATAFEDQLPQVLLLLAGALRAGHGFTTAMEGAVRESDEPARSELRRAAVEHRLGRPVADSLRGVAERLHSNDLRWVVNAIQIQQEVGGNLAELLDNVAGTLRARASLGRTVKALAAEGRYSAWIIGALPFVMFGVMTVVNPTYVEFLYTDPIGIAMLLVGLLLMVMGGFVLRKIVQPRF